MMTGDLEAEQVAFSYRRMPQHTGGKGSYGHRHKEQEEIYFVASGKLHSSSETTSSRSSRERLCASLRDVALGVERRARGRRAHHRVERSSRAARRDDAEYLENFWPA